MIKFNLIDWLRILILTIFFLSSQKMLNTWQRLQTGANVTSPHQEMCECMMMIHLWY